MKFRMTIDVPEETIINYQTWAKDYSDLFDVKVLEDFIKDTIEDQTRWEVETCSLIDKKELKSLKEFLQKKS